jgi:uncharacterized protein YndB with AHSA1/START domain
MAAKNKSNEIHLTRVYDAPVKMVWDAWTDPQQVGQWWGPRGFTLTTHSKDLRPGGTWRYTMHGPDGTDYPNLTTYHEVEPLARLVYDHGATDDRPPLFRVTVTFAEEKGRTRMEMTMALATPEAAEQTRKFIKQAGGEATWDRLAEHLGQRSAGKERFVINRSFDVGLEKMYEVWTDPRHFARWLPPTGFSMEILRGEIKPGAKIFYRMSNGAGVTMYGRVNYLKLERPRHLLYTQEFCDEHEGPARHPMAPTWPALMRTDVQLTAEGGDRTRVTITWEPAGDSTNEELQTFVQGRAGMTQGWTGSFDKLEAYLAEKGDRA